MADDQDCPTPGCDRDKRAGDLLCRRCWYVLPEGPKQDYRQARAALEASRTRQNIAAVKSAKKRIIDLLNPEGPRS